jgi:hypothetical protein
MWNIRTFIEDNQILTDLFNSSDQHIQLIQKGCDIVKLLAGDGKITENHLTLLWNCVKTQGLIDPEIKNLIFKLLVDISRDIDLDMVRFTLGLITEAEEDINAEHLHLFFEIVTSCREKKWV